MDKIINLKQLFQRPDKSIEIEIKLKLESITSKNELIFIDFFDSKNYYKGLTIMKSDIFPKPPSESIILTQKIYYKFDEAFQQRLFLKAKLSEESINEKNTNTIVLNTLDFSEERIMETLKRYLNIKEDL